MKHTPARRREDGRALAIETEEKILLALSKFGWLTIAHIHALFWPESKYPRMAQRTLSRLAKDGFVAGKALKSGRKLFALTSAGANRVQATSWVSAKSRRNFFNSAETHFEHRSLANDVCIFWLRKCEQYSTGYFTEHQIQSKKSPLNAFDGYLCSSKPKIPDALLLAYSGEEEAKTDPYGYIYWVEVERGDKKKGEQEHMIQALISLVGFGTEDFEVVRKPLNYRLKGAIVVCPRPVFATRLLNDIERFLKKEQENFRGNLYSWTRIFKNILIWEPGKPFVSLQGWKDRLEEERKKTIRKKWRVTERPLA